MSSAPASPRYACAVEMLDDLRGARFFLGRRDGAAGKDPAAARRLRHAGHHRRSDDGDVAHVRERGHAVADVHVGQRILERGDQIVHRPIEPLDEGDRDPLRSGLDVDRRRADFEAVLPFVLAEVRLAHRGTDVEQRHALAVHRYVHLLGDAHRQHRVAAVDAAERLVVHRRADHVLAVGREDVHRGDAAARTHRRAVHVPHLRLRAPDLVGDRRRARVAIADGEPADLARRAKVALHQRRRKTLHVGNVVEAAAERVGRQERVHVDVDTEQVAHGAGILGAVQSLERPPPRVRIQRRGLVDPRFERVHQRAHRGGIGVPRGWRRHHARPQLPDHLLSGLGVRLDLCRVETRQDEPAGLTAFAVATRAILRDELVLGLDRWRRGVRTGSDVRRRHLDRRLGRTRWSLGGLRGRCHAQKSRGCNRKGAFRMIEKYRALEGASEAFCRLTLSPIVIYWSKVSRRESRAHARVTVNFRALWLARLAFWAG